MNMLYDRSHIVILPRRARFGIIALRLLIWVGMPLAFWIGVWELVGYIGRTIWK